MSDVELPPNWEAVVGEDGRTYYWNVDTDEVTWSRRRASVEVQESSRRSSGSASGPPRPPPSLVPQASSEAAGLAETSTVGPLPAAGAAPPSLRDAQGASSRERWQAAAHLDEGQTQRLSLHDVSRTEAPLAADHRARPRCLGVPV